MEPRYWDTPLFARLTIFFVGQICPPPHHIRILRFSSCCFCCFTGSLPWSSLSTFTKAQHFIFHVTTKNHYKLTKKNSRKKSFLHFFLSPLIHGFMRQLALLCYKSRFWTLLVSRRESAVGTSSFSSANILVSFYAGLRHKKGIFQSWWVYLNFTLNQRVKVRHKLLTCLSFNNIWWKKQHLLLKSQFPHLSLFWLLT